MWVGGGAVGWQGGGGGVVVGGNERSRVWEKQAVWTKDVGWFSAWRHEWIPKCENHSEFPSLSP